MDHADDEVLAAAITALQSALTDVRETIPRCRACECFLTVAAQARLDLKGVASPAAEAARERFAAWLDEAEGRVSVCNNCDVCVPSGPYQRLTAALARARGAGGPA